MKGVGNLETSSGVPRREEDCFGLGARGLGPLIRRMSNGQAGQGYVPPVYCTVLAGCGHSSKWRFDDGTELCHGGYGSRSSDIFGVHHKSDTARHSHRLRFRVPLPEETLPMTYHKMRLNAMIMDRLESAMLHLKWDMNFTLALDGTAYMTKVYFAGYRVRLD